MIPSLLADTSGAETITKATGDPTLTLFGGFVLIILLFWFFASDRDRVRRNVGLVIMAATIFFSFLAIASPASWWKVITFESSLGEVGNLRRGIDIAGGVSYVLKIEAGPNGAEVTPQSLTEVKLVLEKRLYSKFQGVSVVVQPEDDRIEVQVPDVSDLEAEEIEEMLQQVAVLEIYKEDLFKTRELNSGEYYDPLEGTWDIEKFEKDADLLDNRIFPVVKINKEGEKIIDRYIVTTQGRPVIEGNDIQDAFPNRQTGKSINVELTSEGGKKNEFFTRNEMTQGVDRIAIIFDGECISNPTQAAESLGKRFEISGMENLTEAKRLAANMTNPLKNKPTIDVKSKVSATLGEATVNQGLKAGVVGLGITLIFVLLYYRLAGIIALIGLSINILVVFGSMALMNATFTLPGIAGVILTIGVAIDANVLIYERLREERELGKSFVDALRIAYEKAFSAIIDANITTLITAVILFAMATGSIKGFAVTLTIGIMGTLLAALVFTRTLFWLGGDTGIIKNPKFLNLIPKNAFNFISLGKITLVASSILVIASLAFTGSKGNDSLGVDFTGGANLTYDIENAIFEANPNLTQSAIQAKIDTLDLSQGATSQVAAPAGSEKKVVSIRLSDNQAEQEMVAEAFRSLGPKLQEKDESGEFIVKESVTKISASMGAEFLNNSIIALAVGLVGIMIYITLRFEFSFAVGALCALAHDIIIVVGIIVLKGDEISMIHVGAFLTIAGYSINDTIVVFDRIRENLKYSESSVSEIMNLAISSTLSRTILTSVTTFVAVFVLFVFGGTALSDFSFAIMAGVIVGTYSSIFVASPVVWLFAKARGNDLREEVITAQKRGEEEEFETEPDADPEPAK